MIKYRIGDLLEQPDIRYIGHCANCFCRMGSGFVVPLLNKYPEAYEADKQTIPGDKEKLGTFSEAKGQDQKIIFNIYGQYHFGAGTRNVNYEAIYSGLMAVRQRLRIYSFRHPIGFPYKMGSDLAGGDWRIIEKMIEVAFEGYPVIICVLPKFAGEIEESKLEKKI